MKLEDAKMEFVQSWGVLGSEWGIPKSMGQIHALLLSNKEGISAEDVMESIQLSRGNVNTNLRELIDWGLITRQSKLGERKEFFQANYDVWTIARNIVEKRKKKEIEPVQKLLKSLKDEKLEGDKADVKHFQKMLKEIDDFVTQMDQLSELMIRMNDNLIFKKIINIIGKRK